LLPALLTAALLLGQSGVLAAPEFWRTGTAELALPGDLETPLTSLGEPNQAEASGPSLLAPTFLSSAEHPLFLLPPREQHPRPGETVIGRHEQPVGVFLPRPPPAPLSA
jgi:hypothetical protein